jgi:hypothetical protein
MGSNLREQIAGSPPSGAPARSPRYDERLQSDPRWALSEASLYFEGQGGVHKTLQKITARLRELGVPYAVVGGLALFHHGFRRFTEDVDLLVTPDGLKLIHDRLDGLGYLPPFAKSKNLRDTETGVKIEFLVTGQYPGDGKPKPVAFPDPADVGVEIDGVRYLNLPTLVELKLASGMSANDRLKDLVDVQELIRVLGLPRDFGNQLGDFVKGKYEELWGAVYGKPKRFVRTWRNKGATANARSIDDMIACLEEAAGQLRAMKADGVTLDPDGGTADDDAQLVTTDPAVARKYDMEDESELWEGGEDPPS